MQLYEESEELQYHDEITIDILGILFKIVKCLKKHWLQLLLILIIAVGGCVGICSYLYHPVYQAKITYGLSKTKDSATDALLAKRMNESFQNIYHHSDLKELIAADFGRTDGELPGTIEMGNDVDSSILTVTVSTSNYEDTNKILEGFDKVFPEYISKMTGSMDLFLMDKILSDNIPIARLSIFFIGGLGIALGFLIDIFLVFLYVCMNANIQTDSDMKNITSLECLAYVPKVKLKKRSEKKEKYIFAENKANFKAYRKTMQAIQIRILQRLKPNEKMILVAGSLPQEGKSSFAANFAVNLSKSGYRVLVLDGDLRKPSMDEIFEVKDEHLYLQDILQNEDIVLDDIIQNISPSLYLISAKKGEMEVQKILRHEKLSLILDELRECFDYIIIDSPPAALCVDSSLIAEYADTGIYLVRHDYSVENAIREGIELLQSSGIRIIGYVLNNVTSEFYKNSSSYGYSYSRYKYNKEKHADE